MLDLDLQAASLEPLMPIVMTYSHNFFYFAITPPHSQSRATATSDPHEHPFEVTDAAQVPTLETPQGGVFESNAIARYVARIADKGLYGTTSFEAVWCSLLSPT